MRCNSCERDVASVSQSGEYVGWCRRCIVEYRDWRACFGRELPPWARDLVDLEADAPFGPARI